MGQQVVLGNPALGRLGEVVAVEQRHALVMPYSAVSGVRRGCLWSRCRVDRVPVGSAFGQSRRLSWATSRWAGADQLQARRPLRAEAPNPLTRRSIDRVIPVGVRVVDALCTLVKASGWAFCWLWCREIDLGMMARHAECDAVVIALVERGREVREFVGAI